MKTFQVNFNVFTRIAFSIVALAMCLALTSCSDDNEPTTVTPIVSEKNNEVVAVPFFVENAAGEMPSDPSELIYESRKKNPVISPDGRHITWGEFASVRGEVEVECTEEGTAVSMKLSGLIPYGTYTIWNVIFDDPGIDPTHPMLGLEGLGAGGMGDGSDNSFLANGAGEAEIAMVTPGGDLSMVGAIGNCALTDNFEFHVVGAYHIDGKVYGPDLGPDGTVTEQFGFVFLRDQ